MRLKIVPEDEDSLAFILSGDFHASDALALKQQVGDMLDRTGYKHLIIDMNEVTSLESTSLGVLTSACRQAEKLKKRLSLRDPSAKVNSLLQITGLNRVFNTILTPRGRQVQ